ncbi:GroES-like zinc-binding alcohol dehydrogenase family protein [Gossypium australe]|uniref:GroES-like zinc-binding alcohol dehydrogenase family protein n=1 Tax=Gossypium australe TaxID=47621 RepID=A0A5B6WYC4_9ROSI|nr:GroES-like zinc-binding alcohol dehydrogenase family protein [Gossypium australe]
MEFHKKIEYEHLPTICFSCDHYGHTQYLCPKSVNAQQPSKINFLDKESVLENRPELSENNLTNSSGDYSPWMLVEKRNR